MAEEEKRMPGYTGYKPQYVNDDQISGSTRDNRFYIPGMFSFLYINLLIIGYCGYVPSIKSENAFGESYGKTTGASVSGNIK